MGILKKHPGEGLVDDGGVRILIALKKITPAMRGIFMVSNHPGETSGNKERSMLGGPPLMAIASFQPEPFSKGNLACDTRSTPGTLP